MDDKNNEELLETLRRIGFNADDLASTLLDKTRLGLPDFVIDHYMEIRGESISFWLYFEREGDSKLYRLSKYDAIYKVPFSIDHKNINGVDTALLEQQMAQVDWKYPSSSSEAKENAAWQKGGSLVQDILDKLWRLSSSEASYGKVICDQLRIKFMSSTPFDSPELDAVCKAYEHKGTFLIDGPDLVTAPVAYDILSGKIENLTESLQGIEFDLYQETLKALRDNGDNFSLKTSLNQPEGVIDYDISCLRQEGKLLIDHYIARLTIYEPIQHGIYAGVDTQELEGKMKEIDWHDDANLHYLDEQENPCFEPDVEEIIGRLNRLSGDPQGQIVSCQLQLKYWVGAELIESFIDDDVWDYFHSLSKREAKFGPEVHSQSAYNLLCGRAAGAEIDGATQWQRFSFHEKDGNIQYTAATIPGYSIEDIWDDLNYLPRFHCEVLSLEDALLRGDLLPILLYSDRRLFLQADPENRTIRLYDENKRLILANLKMDPDWLPSPQNAQQMPLKAIETPRPDTTTQSEKRLGKGQQKRNKM